MRSASGPRSRTQASRRSAVVMPEHAAARRPAARRVSRPHLDGQRGLGVSPATRPGCAGSRILLSGGTARRRSVRPPGSTAGPALPLGGRARDVDRVDGIRCQAADLADRGESALSGRTVLADQQQRLARGRPSAPSTWRRPRIAAPLGARGGPAPGGPVRSAARRWRARRSGTPGSARRGATGRAAGCRGRRSISCQYRSGPAAADRAPVRVSPGPPGPARTSASQRGRRRQRRHRRRRTGSAGTCPAHRTSRSRSNGLSPKQRRQPLATPCHGSAAAHRRAGRGGTRLATAGE